MTDLSHLHALLARQSSEKSRLAEAKTEAEVELRTVWLQQIQMEIYKEYEFLGIQPDWNPEHTENEVSDDELLAELGF